jgi:hypothetical protein
MTQITSYQINCQCGNPVDVKVYQSVNVTVDPQLLPKVKSRQINNYVCDKCGVKSELSYRFLYVDMKKGKWIWCYPEMERKNLKLIEEELGAVAGIDQLLKQFGQTKPEIVFGYDELLRKID